MTSNTTTDLEYLKHFPFLSNSQNIMVKLNITIEKIDNTNIYNHLLIEINDEISFLIEPPNSKIPFFVSEPYFEIAKFYLTIIVLKKLNNIALLKIFVKRFQKRINFFIKFLLSECSTEAEKGFLFIDLLLIFN